MGEKTWAVILDGKVANVVLWDGESDWPHGDVVDLADHPSVGIGWDWDGEAFTDNRPIEEDS